MSDLLKLEFVKSLIFYPLVMVCYPRDHSKMVMGYRFYYITKDGKEVDSYEVGVFLNPSILGIEDEVVVHREVSSHELMYGNTITIPAQDEKVKKYIEHLKEELEKDPSSETHKKELDLLKNITAIVVNKKPYFSRWID